MPLRIRLQLPARLTHAQVTSWLKNQSTTLPVSTWNLDGNNQLTVVLDNSTPFIKTLQTVVMGIQIISIDWS